MTVMAAVLICIFCLLALAWLVREKRDFERLNREYERKRAEIEQRIRDLLRRGRQ